LEPLLTELIDKFTALGFTASEEKLDEAMLKRVEGQYGFTLPELYRQFLLNYEKGLPEQFIQYPAIESIPRADKKNLLIFGSFLAAVDGEDSLEENMKQYDERIPASIIPIAEDLTGNLICIGVRGEAKGRIYYWDHENEMAARNMLQLDLKGITSIDDYWENIYLIAESFIDFIRSMRIEELKQVTDVICDLWYRSLNHTVLLQWSTLRNLKLEWDQAYRNNTGAFSRNLTADGLSPKCLHR
jgi:hypothetical protein